jgi:hypothetical protein
VAGVAHQLEGDQGLRLGIVRTVERVASRRLHGLAAFPAEDGRELQTHWLGDAGLDGQFGYFLPDAGFEKVGDSYFREVVGRWLCHDIWLL